MKQGLDLLEAQVRQNILIKKFIMLPVRREKNSVDIDVTVYMYAYWHEYNMLKDGHVQNLSTLF